LAVDRRPHLIWDQVMKLILICLTTSLTWAAPPPPTGTVVGRFDNVEAGDYIHLNLIGKKGERISLICSDLPKSVVKGIDCNDLLNKPSEFKNAELVVSYREATMFIPEANQKITWKYVVRIDLKK
jgi:hypothetical protein